MFYTCTNQATQTLSRSVAPEGGVSTPSHLTRKLSVAFTRLLAPKLSTLRSSASATPMRTCISYWCDCGSPGSCREQKAAA